MNYPLALEGKHIYSHGDCHAAFDAPVLNGTFPCPCGRFTWTVENGEMRIHEAETEGLSILPALIEQIEPLATGGYGGFNRAGQWVQSPDAHEFLRLVNGPEADL